MGEDNQSHFLAIATMKNEPHVHVHSLLSHRYMECLVL